MKKLTKQEFIINAKKIHGDKYDYSLVNYVNNKTKVRIICKEHGIFEQQPTAHMKGQKCKLCVYENYANDSSQFIINAKKIHGDKYDYSLVNYVNNKTKVRIICKKHGVFEQRPDNHIGLKHRCPNCNKITTDDFIVASKEIHGNKYDYSQVEYKTASKKVKIICHKHGEFLQMPYSHVRGVGCPICNESKGEKLISKLLKDLKVKHEKQKKFIDCVDEKQLPFDFYLPEHNTCIEFDGELHFKSVKYFGGYKKLLTTQRHDKIKNEYCHNNNIHLIRIKYDENINEKIKLIFT